MRTYTVTLVRFAYGRRTKRISRTIKYTADPLLAYAQAQDACRPGEQISTFWYD